MRCTWVVVLLLLFSACAEWHDSPSLEGQEIRITFLHTSDIHSRLLPFRAQVTYTDATMGLEQENAPFGGIARLGYLINRERAKSHRVLYLDSGDIFQGAPIFNVFDGEAEFRAMSYLNPDAMVIGNHEFDTGLTNLINKAKEWVSFPMLAANYYFMPDNELGARAQPFTIINVDGVKIGVIGVGDFSSLSSLSDIGNSLKMMPINPIDTVNDYVGILRPAVDMVVLLSHAGLRHDQEIIAGTCGVDMVFGGHLHIVLDPPKTVKDNCGNDVLLVHSGAFAKYLGRLDVVTKRDSNGTLRVLSHEYELFPVDSTVPEEPKLAELMEHYRLKLNQVIDLTSVYGYSPKLLTKYGYEGGDSSLGNLVAEAIRKYARVDIGFTNTLGIRSNMYPGPITLDDMFNIFPFENSIVLMYMAGTDLRELLNYNTRRSSGRGCVSQMQVSGLEFVMNCNANPPPFYFDCWDEKLVPCVNGCEGSSKYDKCMKGCVNEDFRTCVQSASGMIEDKLCLDYCLPIAADDGLFEDMKECLYDCFPRAEELYLNECPDPLTESTEECGKQPIVGNSMYEVATNDYIAHGGSGFYMLKANSTQSDTELPLRDAVLEVIMTSGSCLDFCTDLDGDSDLSACSVFQGCLDKVGEFYSSFCEKVDKTGGKFGGMSQGCAADTGECFDDSDCYYPDVDCADGGCAKCESAAQCMSEDLESLCVDGRCVKWDHVCSNSRCTRRCETDDDCPGDAPGAQAQCVKGLCAPPPAQSCLSAGECINPYKVCYSEAPICQFDTDCGGAAICRSKMCIPDRTPCGSDADCDGDWFCSFGLCSPGKLGCQKDGDCGDGGECRGGICTASCGNCSAESDCPAGLSCVKNLCVAVPAECVDYRCRLKCTKNSGCKSGEICSSGLCLPGMCLQELGAEDRCLMNAEWFAQQTCINTGCVDSRVDGRIERILPENLDELQFGFIPNNPEDYDPL